MEKPRKIVRAVSKQKRIYLLLILLPVLVVAGILWYTILRDLPSPTRLSSSSLPQSTQIFDRNGTLLYTIYSNKNQTFVPLATIPLAIRQATIAVEDKDFYKHGAVDLRGITRAAYSTIFHQQIQGGSTLTQQLVKTSLLTPEQTLLRKVRELVLAFATEILYPKDKILELYLNQVPYGGTAYGVEAAAQTYFGKHAKDLDLAESALLAGLPEAPTTYSPFGTHPEYAKTRQEEILRKMQEQGYITRTQMEEASKQPLHYQKVADNIKAPHFVLYVKDLLSRKYGQQVVEQGGLTVKTSLDLPTQDFVQDTVASEVAKLASNHVSNGASVVTNPQTGEILAMVGSRDYFDENYDGNVNVTIALRQPGSSIKPINYAVGLIKGYTAATPFIDRAICFPNQGGKSYCPLNYDGKFHGVVQMRYALGNSINTSAVKMLKLNGIDAMIATASAMGIASLNEPNRYGLSLTLGGGEVTMLEMATAYDVFANGGYRIDLHPILKVTDSSGKVLEEYKAPRTPIFAKRVLPEGVAFIISQMLADNGARELEFGSNSELKVANQFVSVKTGTTNDFRDNWTIGYTPQVLVATWVGNNDNTPMGGLTSGITGAAPIWNKIMTRLLETKPSASPIKPDSVIGKYICSTSGLLPPPDGTADKCPTRFEYFIRGTEPRIVDPGKVKVFIDKSTNNPAPAGITDNVEERSEVIVTDPTGDRYCVTCAHPEPTPK